MHRLIALLLVCSSASAQVIPSHFDSHFIDATEQWLPGRDWRELKAQCYQESLLKPMATSPVGAMGLCQFMPATWRDVPARIRAHGDAYAPIASVYAAGWYMRKLRGMWSAPRPDWDRQRLAWASYNAGAGNLIKAQRICGGPSGFNEIMLCLPNVTGRHSRETITYVNRIDRWLIQLRVTQ